MIAHIFRAARAVFFIILTATPCAMLYTAARYISGSIAGEEGLIRCYIFSFTAIASAEAVIICARYFIRSHKEKKLNDSAFDKGYSEQLFRYYEKKVRRAGSDIKKGSALMKLAACYTEAGRYTDAYAALNQIRPASLTGPMRADFYNCALYTALMAGDTESAEIIYLSGVALLDEYMSPAIEHTIGVLEYSRGNYYEAELTFQRILDGICDKHMICECNIFLIMIFLRTERLEEAKLLAEQTVTLVYSYQSKSRLIRLMSCIEKRCKVRSTGGAQAADIAKAAPEEHQEEERSFDNNG